MFKTIASLFFLLFVSPAFAQTSAGPCPDFYRFVDFGIEGNDGIYYRGGPIFRAESLGGRPLLLRGQTECRAVRQIASDGHGNPIPVVTSINYDPQKTDINLTELRVSRVKSASLLAQESVVQHTAALQSAGTQITRGPDFLCAMAKGADMFSCQLVSPYPGNMPLVVYCDAVLCRMPVMAMNDSTQVTAAWQVDANASENMRTTGTDMVAKALKIQAFLEPLT